MKKRALKGIARLSYYHYRLVILAALLITFVSAYYALKLEVTTEVIDLLPDDSPVVKTFNRAMERYGSMDFLIVVVENKYGKEVENREDFVDEFAGELEKLDSVRFVDYRIKDEVRSFYRNTFYDYALLYLSTKELDTIKTRLTDEAISRRMAVNRESLRTAISSAARELIIRDPLGMRDIFEKYLSTARGKLKIHFKDGYYFSEDLSMMFMLVKPDKPAQDMTFVKKFLDDITRTEKKVRDRFEDTEDLKIGYTGNYAIASSYSRVIQRDVVITFLTSFLGVMILFLITFRRAAAILYVGVPLIMAVLWTLCLSYLYIGNLNIVTSAFCAILIGLGIDFAVHMFNKYAAEKAAGKEEKESLETALCETGSSILTAALTTSFAFFAVMVTDFKGLAELGFMTGTGILFCLVSMFFVLPAMLRLRSRYPLARSKFKKIRGFRLEGIVGFVERYRIAVIGAGVILTLVLGSASFFIRFDDDFRNIRPQNSEPIKLQKHLVRKIGSPLNYTLVITKGESVEDILRKGDEVVERLNRLVEMDHVLSYNSLRTFIPSREHQLENLEWLRREREKDPGIFSARRLEASFQRALKESGFRSIEPFRESLNNIIRALSVNEPLTIDDLRESGIGDLVSRFLVRENGSYELATYVYPSYENPQKSVGMIVDRFGDLEDTEVVGVKVLSTELKRIIEKDSALAAALALAGVFGFLFYHFRKIRVVALAVIPLILSVIWMVGTMVLLKMKFNLINISILPIIIGIGVDDGIHIVHHYLEDAHKNLVETAGLTGRAVVITSLTTIVGFGSLLFADYPGLASVGVVAILGVSYALIASVTVLPALLSIYGRNL